MSKPNTIRAFTLVELLVVVAVVALLIGILLPSLAGARDAARTMLCSSNQRQLITAWHLYAADFEDRAMPLGYWTPADIGSGPRRYWWGTHGTTATPPDYTQGFISTYLEASLRDGSVFECPSQPWGSYEPQGPSKSITSTYGYNGYYLSPAKTPGWAFSIDHRPWKRLPDLHRPTELMVFADTLLPPLGSGLPTNNALLDPPLLFERFGGGRWRHNPSPTTAFRHGSGATVTALADGHVSAVSAQSGWLTHSELRIGSVGGSRTNGPRYVPDWERWSMP